MTIDGRSPQQVANFVTTLNAWCRVHERDKKSVVKEDFDSAFDVMFLRFQDILSESIAPRTLTDRCEQMLWWRRMLETLRGHDTLPASFSEALNVAFARSGLTKVALGRMAGLSLPALNHWLSTDANFSEPGNAQHVSAVEKALDLSAGTLMRRVTGRRRARYDRAERKAVSQPQTTYGVRMQQNRKRLTSYSLPCTNRIRQQWLPLIALKTDKDRPDGTLRNSWRVKPANRVAVKPHWSMCVNGGICVTAYGQFRQLMSYLGFLGLGKIHGGKALPMGELDTLAWLVRSDYVIEYIKFVRRRAGGILHNGLFTLLDTFRSHLRPKTGYVWLSPNLAETLPASQVQDETPAGMTPSEAWQMRCQKAYDELMEFTRKLQSDGKPQRSRNPKERLNSVVSNAFPMKELLRITHSLENDPPRPSQVRDYAIWIRDVLMLKLLARHPLRALHFSVMTFRGPKPNLSRTNTGWYLNFELMDFKNEKSDAVRPYSVALDPSLTHWVNRYLSEARPVLMRATECDYFFLPSRVGNVSKAAPDVEFGAELESNGAWSACAISGRVKALTGSYVADGVGFGMHGVRHIAATDHLRRRPFEYVVVARMLNDSLATVMREYDHTEMQDGVRILGASVDQAEQELREEFGR